MNAQVHAKTIRGRRERNEDTYGLQPELGLYVIADGMGGQAGGDFASKLAVEVICEVFHHPAHTGLTEDSHPEDFARAAISRAHGELTRQRVGARRHMGTTVAILSLQDEHATIAHIGDSRVYRLRAGVLEQLTRDHSFYNEMITRGVTVQEHVRQRIANVITRAVGMPASLGTPDVLTVLCEPGDRFLLSTDGLHDYVDEECLTRGMAQDDLSEGCEQLIAQAYDAGSKDNITAVVVAV